MLNHEQQICIKEGVAFISGDLNFTTVMPLLEHQFSGKALRNVQALNLSQLEQADSAGLALLCELKRQHPELKFEHIPDWLKRVIEVSGLSTILH